MADVWVSVEAVAIVVLVFVTFFYAWSTHRIVRETVKDREIRRVEKSLERFYYPLMGLTDLKRYPYPPYAKFGVPEVYVHRMEVIERFWDDIQRYQYLARSKAVRLLLVEFMELSSVHVEDSPARKLVVNARDKLMDQVLKDISRLEKKLALLHGGVV